MPLPRSLARLVARTDGVSAIEFALVAPFLMALFLGIFNYGTWLTVDHGLQQLAGEAARASLAGLSDAERAALARGFVATNVGAYGLIDPARLQVELTGSAASGGTFQVALIYDLRELSRFGTLIPLPDPQIRRVAVIQRGGY